jgi:hypothetical protein
MQPILISIFLLTGNNLSMSRDVLHLIRSCISCIQVLNKIWPLQITFWTSSRITQMLGSQLIRSLRNPSIQMVNSSLSQFLMRQSTIGGKSYQISTSRVSDNVSSSWYSVCPKTKIKRVDHFLLNWTLLWYQLSSKNGLSAGIISFLTSAKQPVSLNRNVKMFWKFCSSWVKKFSISAKVQFWKIRLTNSNQPWQVSSAQFSSFVTMSLQKLFQTLKTLSKLSLDSAWKPYRHFSLGSH